MAPALSSLNYLQMLIVKEKEAIKKKQKFIRCLRVRLLLFYAHIHAKAWYQ